MGQGLFQMCGFLGKVPHEIGNDTILSEYDMDIEFVYLQSAWNEHIRRENEATNKVGN